VRHLRSGAWGWLAALAFCGAVHAEETAPAAAPPERQAIPGTHVSLEVPAGFHVAREFAGIGRAADFTSVMVTELAVPRAIALESLSEESLTRSGLQRLGGSDVKVDGQPAARVDAVQKIGSKSFRKWFLLLGDETHSVLLTATAPDELKQQHEAALVAVLESARWEEAGAPPASSAAPELRFSVKEAAPLRIVRSADDSLVLSEAQAQKGHVTPVVTAGASRAQVAIDDLAAFARSRLEQTPSVFEVQIRSQAARPLGKLAGHEIRADAKDAESGRAVRVHQVLAEDGGRYYLVQGIFDAADDARLSPAFDAVAASFELRNPSKSAVKAGAN
jgi:hypothetical protein